MGGFSVAESCRTTERSRSAIVAAETKAWRLRAKPGHFANHKMGPLDSLPRRNFPIPDSQWQTKLPDTNRVAEKASGYSFSGRQRFRILAKCHLEADKASGSRILL